MQTKVNLVPYSDSVNCHDMPPLIPHEVVELLVDCEACHDFAEIGDIVMSITLERNERDFALAITPRVLWNVTKQRFSMKMLVTSNVYAVPCDVENIQMTFGHEPGDDK